jgi:hypothetical protein
MHHKWNVHMLEVEVIVNDILSKKERLEVYFYSHFTNWFLSDHLEVKLWMIAIENAGLGGDISYSIGRQRPLSYDINWTYWRFFDSIHMLFKIQ